MFLNFITTPHTHNLSKVSSEQLETPAVLVQFVLVNQMLFAFATGNMRDEFMFEGN